MQDNNPTNSNTKAWSVCVIDMFNYQESDGEFEVTGFADEAAATEYARRRTRDSLEHLREKATSVKDLSDQWFSFGEDCVVVGGTYKGYAELAYFIKHQATSLERNWWMLTPDPEMRSMLLRVKQARCGDE
jgi:hypothetical protein